jgi:hypothetical protein
MTSSMWLGKRVPAFAVPRMHARRQCQQWVLRQRSMTDLRYHAHAGPKPEPKTNNEPTDISTPRANLVAPVDAFAHDCSRVSGGRVGVLGRRATSALALARQ